MASFMSNFFQSGRDKAAQEAARPVTPTKNTNNNFLNPLNTEDSMKFLLDKVKALDTNDAFLEAMSR